MPSLVMSLTSGEAHLDKLEHWLITEASARSPSLLTRTKQSKDEPPKRTNCCCAQCAFVPRDHSKLKQE